MKSGTTTQSTTRLIPANPATDLRMRIAFWVAAGSGIGGVFRVLVAAMMIKWLGNHFPYGVLTVNVAGSFAIGFIATLTAPDGRVFMNATARQFFLAGLCGGFTTFSFFSLQTMHLLQSGRWRDAVLYAAGTLLLSLLAVVLGHMAGLKLNKTRQGMSR
jgi:fluoride exporter